MFVSLFRGSWDVWMSRDVMRGMEVWIFVEFELRFCMHRWPLLVARDFGKYFLMRDSVRSGQDDKWPCLIARKKSMGEV